MRKQLLTSPRSRGYLVLRWASSNRNALDLLHKQSDPSNKAPGGLIRLEVISRRRARLSYIGHELRILEPRVAILADSAVHDAPPVGMAALVRHAHDAPRGQLDDHAVGHAHEHSHTPLVCRQRVASICTLVLGRLGLGLGWYNAVTRAHTATLTGLGTPWGVAMIVWGRGAVGCRLTSAVLC